MYGHGRNATFRVRNLKKRAGSFDDYGIILFYDLEESGRFYVESILPKLTFVIRFKLQLMKNRLWILNSIIILMSFEGQGQSQNKIWYFGYEAGIDFNGTTPVALTNGALTSIDCSASLCDANGNLLLYANGTTVYNANHQVMHNGNGLLGSSNGGQVCVAVPQPGTNLVYIFTVGQFASSNGFRFHVIDMSQQGGLGSVILKNVLLFQPSTERVTAVYNPNDNSYWIITHLWNSNAFYAYKLSSSGFNPTPVISAVGSVHAGGALGYYNSMGQLAISPDGSHIACGIYSMGAVELFHFDIFTGTLSNPIHIGGFTNTWGVCFSPDATKLYVTNWYSSELFQLDISVWDSSMIASSKTMVGTAQGPSSSGWHIGYMQLGPDGKIYAAVFNDNYLAVVNNPDSAGIACNLVDNGFYLEGKTSGAGICNPFVMAQFTSVTENTPPLNITIAANPFDYSLHINASGKIIRELRILDMSGRLIYQSKPNASLAVIDTNTFSNALYLAEVRCREGLVRKKIFVW